MTRKQAIITVLEVLDGKEEYREALEILKDISDELPLTHWSDKSIRDTVEQFIIDNKRVPTASDFRKKGMPPHTVIKQKYSMPLSQWLKENYPSAKPTTIELKEKYTEEFLRDYHRIKPKSANEFNKKRAENTVSWQTLATYYDVKGWRKLLFALGLTPYPGTPRKRPPTKLTVNFYVDN